MLKNNEIKTVKILFLTDFNDEYPDRSIAHDVKVLIDAIIKENIKPPQPNPWKN